MKAYRFLMIFAAWLVLSAPAFAKQYTCVWIGDSIDSFAQDGPAASLATHLIEAERNVSIRNLSSPGGTLGLPGNWGFNSLWTTDTFEHLDGYGQNLDCIIIAAGVNDFGAPNDNWEMVAVSLDRILKWAQRHQKKVLMLDLIWASAAENAAPNHWGMTWAEFRNRRAQLCRRYSECTFAERPREFDVLHPDLYSSLDPSPLHLNSAGQRVRANWVEAAARAAGLF